MISRKEFNKLEEKFNYLSKKHSSLKNQVICGILGHKWEYVGHPTVLLECSKDSTKKLGCFKCRCCDLVIERKLSEEEKRALKSLDS